MCKNTECMQMCKYKMQCIYWWKPECRYEFGEISCKDIKWELVYKFKINTGVGIKIINGRNFLRIFQINLRVDVDMK